MSGRFTVLFSGNPDAGWLRLIDTSLPSPNDIVEGTVGVRVPARSTSPARGLLLCCITTMQQKIRGLRIVDPRPKNAMETSRQCRTNYRHFDHSRG
jgi:hypothetical protein